MAEIDQKDLTAHLEVAAQEGFAPVYLIYGEELLVKEAFKALLDRMLPETARGLSYEAFDDGDTAWGTVVERINTYSLVPGIKVVAAIDTRLFHSRQDVAGLLARARKSFLQKEMRKAARELLSVLSLSGLSLGDVTPDKRKQHLDPEKVGVEGGDWPDLLLTYCREGRMTVPEPGDGATLIQAAITKGFPKGNHLLMTTDLVDRRKSLYKLLKEAGTIIDCSVPKGERRADRQVQETLLREQIRKVLSPLRKGIDPGAFAALVEMTGFDLRTFSTSVAKLADYIGDREQITPEDVAAVLKRSKKDPIYEFTNALTDKDLDGALFYLGTLLDGGVVSHPLQLLGAMVNQIRKLLLVKGFVESRLGKVWQPGLGYPAFQSRVLPAIAEYDRDLLSRETAGFDPPPVSGRSEPRKAKGKGRKEKTVSDLKVAPNPKNAYPVYQMFKKSERFKRKELIEALDGLANTDLKLKSGARQPKLVIEHAVIRICR
jgi:DNA polymerase III subunit delta